MAYISKIKIGNTSYEIKDTVARNAAAAGFAIKVVETLPAVANTEVFYNEWKKYLVLVANNNAEAGTYIEYVLINNGTGSTYNLSWEQIGSTKTNLNGIKSSGTLDNYVTEATPVHTSTSASLTRADYTPAGTISRTKDAAITINDGSYDKTTRVYTDDYALDKTHDYKPVGTVTVTPSTANYSVMKTAGTAYSLTSGSVGQSACTKGTVVNDIGTFDISISAPVITTTGNKKAYTASYVESSEELQLDPIDITASAPAHEQTGSLGTTQAVTDCGEITYTAPTLSGALPTFESKSIVTGISNVTFTGAETKFNIDTEPTATGVSGSITQPEYTFAGTKETGLKVTDVKYDKTTGITLSKVDKTVNVVSSGN
jgi:hypothetical protein